MKVLDADPGLLAAVPEGHRRRAHDRLLARSAAADRGEWRHDELLDEPSSVAVLILEGLLTRNVEIAGTRSREILGEGDLIRPWDDDSASSPLHSVTSWTVLEPARFALLDDRFWLLAGRWPELGAEILHRVLRRSRWLAVLLAIANLRGVEEKVLLFLWHVAGNWGKVTSAGTLVPFGLTHEVIADLIGARRPSVTTALAQMEREGKLERLDDGWLLRAEPPTSGA